MIDFIHSHEQHQECVGDVRLGFIVASGFSESQIDGLGKSCHSSQPSSMTKIVEERFVYFYWITILLIIAVVHRDLIEELTTVGLGVLLNSCGLASGQR